MSDSLIDLDGLQAGAEDFLAAVLGTASQPIWVVDADDVIRFANPAAIAALGYDGADELLGRRCHETIHHTRPDGTPYPAAECPIATGEAVSIDLDWFSRRDGSMFPVSYVSAPIELQGMRVSVVAFTDIGDRFRIERERGERDAALRRVATLVAQGVSTSKLFGAVVEEVGRLFDAHLAGMIRFVSDEALTAVATWAAQGAHPEVTGVWPLEGDRLATRILRSGEPTREDDWQGASGPIAAFVRETLGVRSSVGCPIVVEGNVWGALFVHSTTAEPLPPATEARLADFTELIATAISNVQARDDLAASRARVVATADEERRRVVRDLHDGAQQRLIHTVITLKLARRALEGDGGPALDLVTEALEQAERATAELRELAHGILPRTLTRGGLAAGVDELASRMPVPISVDVSVDRLPLAVEATAYFVIAEALTNVAKHARADGAEVLVRVEDGTVRIEVRDDGTGGARADGPGLVGLADRLAVLDGRLRIESPAGRGTHVAAEIPLPR
jgi:PAS domain S-box-containing protein